VLLQAAEPPGMHSQAEPGNELPIDFDDTKINIQKDIRALSRVQIKRI